MKVGDKLDFIGDVAGLKVQWAFLGVDGEAHGLLVGALGAEPLELLGVAALGDPRDLLDDQVATALASTRPLLLPADALTILLEVHVLVLRRTHRPVLQEGRPQGQCLLSLRELLILLFLQPLPPEVVL